MASLDTVLHLDWWVYFIIVISFFAAAFFLNYVVKKINGKHHGSAEARLEERYINLQNKISNSQQILDKRRKATPLLPTRIPLEVVIEQSNPPTLKSLPVTGEKSDINDYRTVKDRIDIKNFPSTAPDLVNTTNEAKKTSETEIGQQIFLGHIYNEINIVGRSKSLSEADKEGCSQETTSTRQESKSIPSVKKMLDEQYKPIEEFRNWPVKLVEEEFKSTISDTEVNNEVK